LSLPHSKLKIMKAAVLFTLAVLMMAAGTEADAGVQKTV
jgi:hypothetical protein